MALRKTHKVPTIKIWNGKKWGLIWNGYYNTKAAADSFKKRVEKLDKDFKCKAVKVEAGKYVMYMKGAKGTPFKHLKGAKNTKG